MIYKKIIEIMNEIATLGKIRRDEIVPTLLPLLAKYKISIRPVAVSEYKYMNQEASFIAKYELIDTEEQELQSLIVEVPARRF